MQNELDNLIGVAYEDDELFLSWKGKAVLESF